MAKPSKTSKCHFLDLPTMNLRATLDSQVNECSPGSNFQLMRCSFNTVVALGNRIWTRMSTPKTLSSKWIPMAKTSKTSKTRKIQQNTANSRFLGGNRKPPKCHFWPKTLPKPSPGDAPDLIKIKARIPSFDHQEMTQVWEGPKHQNAGLSKSDKNMKSEILMFWRFQIIRFHVNVMSV